MGKWVLAVSHDETQARVWQCHSKQRMENSTEVKTFGKERELGVCVKQVGMIHIAHTTGRAIR